MEATDPTAWDPDDSWDPDDPGNGAQDGDRPASARRSPRDSLAADFAPHAPAPARTSRLVSGDFLLTVNPVDGSEIEPCPPGERPGRPPRHTLDQRAEADRAARPPVPSGPAPAPEPLLERAEERERLARLLAQGRSVRLTGPGGSGRTGLLDLVAEDCADLAPDGVVRLTGCRRGVGDLLHDLFHAVRHAPRYRPDHDELLACVRDIGAVVVLDDLEFGGAALDELLDATPECAYLFAAAPGVPAPSAESAVEEIVLGGLDRAGGADLIERGAGRALTEEEANWAGDLWFESEGLPLRFVQAGALLRQRDRLRAGASAVEEFGVFAEARADADAAPGEGDGEGGGGGVDVPLPPLGEAAAPAPLIASRLSASARAALRLAVALGGETPHQSHLPALVGDTHADAALGELASCGLVSPAGARYRLAAGVLTQLQAAGYADQAEEHARTAARHYAWWAGHPSVTPERVGAEADAVLAALAVLVPAAAPPAEGDGDGEENIAVRLARTAAPAFAAALDWAAWERALRYGAEAARLTGDVAEQAYFHHELGVLALCRGLLDRARAELETSIGLRGALADRRGTVAGRRALALVDDRSGRTPGLAALSDLALTEEEAYDPRAEEAKATVPPPAPVPFPALQPPSDDAIGLIVYPPARPAPAPRAPARHRGGLKGVARRNLVAVGAGALLAAVLGTVVTLGATSRSDADDPTGRGGADRTAGQGADDGDLNAGTPPQDGTGGTQPAAADPVTSVHRPAHPGPDGTRGAPEGQTPAAGGGKQSGGPGGTGGSGRPPASPSSPTPQTSPPSAPPTSPKPPPTTPSSPSAPSTKPPTSPPPSTSTPPSTPPGSSDTSGSASVSAPSRSAGAATSPGAPATDTPSAGDTAL
ncbi:ATP-binding protein [Streptomyces sp. NPDC046985]|uniref:ATP-binding protein n=1 Tax=Streptomyces sp. NPDC046985 TaxID=3155377 RepID=UPI0033C159A9